VTSTRRLHREPNAALPYTKTCRGPQSATAGGSGEIANGKIYLKACKQAEIAMHTHCRWRKGYGAPAVESGIADASGDEEIVKNVTTNGLSLLKE
jgi:hypothetical protein